MMSAKSQRHYDRYKDNLALAVELEEKLDDVRGWSCVVRFYAALHLVNAYLIDKPSLRFDPKSSDHKERKAALARCPELRETPDKYRLLRDYSESVRYDVGFAYTAKVRENSISLLEKIVAIVEPKLKRA
jgi:hypothetical protein